jgi:hypothetical protein
LKQVTMFKTLDGIAHPSFEAATRHAEQRFSEALTRLAHLAVRQEKYIAMCEFINQNLKEFERLSALKADIALSAPEEE